MIRRAFLSLAFAAACATGLSAHAEEAAPPKVLFLTKSAGFQHSVITRENDQPGLAETVLSKVVKEMGGEATCTKDASLINAENLKNYNVVVFYTTGILTEAGTDGRPPMGENGMQELQDWLNAGGGFVGFHCASDTFHGEGDAVTPYISMLGGEFAGHGTQFFGLFTVLDKEHPAMAPFESPYRVNDEWYYFKNMDEKNVHVLALLNPDKAKEKLGQKVEPYSRSYPIAWCKGIGKGRLYYNAMGHREDVWESEVFQKSLAGALTWAKGDAPLNADPNWEQAMAAVKQADAK